MKIRTLPCGLTSASKITRNTWVNTYRAYRALKKAEKAYKDAGHKYEKYIEPAKAYDKAHNEWLDWAVDVIRNDTGEPHSVGLIIDEMCRYAHTKPIDLSAFTPREQMLARLRDKLPPNSSWLNGLIPFREPSTNPECWTDRVNACHKQIEYYQALDKQLLILGLSLSQIVWLHATDNIYYGTFQQGRSEAPVRKLP